MGITTKNGPFRPVHSPSSIVDDILGFQNNVLTILHTSENLLTRMGGGAQNDFHFDKAGENLEILSLKIIFDIFLFANQMER